MDMEDCYLDVVKIPDISGHQKRIHQTFRCLCLDKHELHFVAIVFSRSKCPSLQF